MTTRAFADDAHDFISRDCAAVQGHIVGLIRRNIRFEPLRNSGFEARVKSSALARSQILRVELPHGMRFFTEKPQDNLTVFLVEAGAIWFQSGATRLDCTAGGALAINTATMDHGACHEGTRLTVFTIRTEDIAHRLEALLGGPATKQLAIAASFDPGSPTGATLAALIATATAGLCGQAPFANAPQTAELLRDAIVAMVIENLPHDHAGARGRETAEATPWQIRQAVDYIAAHAEEALTVRDVALAVGIGLRSLQQGFRRYRQTSPHEYIKATKLSGIRDELLNPASRRSIEDVARHWGFVNRGHFATEYRRAYGELPSETRRAR